MSPFCPFVPFFRPDSYPNPSLPSLESTDPLKFSDVRSLPLSGFGPSVSSVSCPIAPSFTTLQTPTLLHGRGHVILNADGGNVAGAHVKNKSPIAHSHRQGRYRLLWKWMKVGNRLSRLNREVR